ncbi:MAG: ArsR/SmtB family transcription factor [Candidatus Hodarchaeota archaeon]
METQTAQINILDELVQNFDSKFFKTLSEPVRLDILKFLIQNGRADIGTIAEHMPQDRSVISRHLNLMHEAGILNCEKETRHMFYEVNGTAFIDKLEKITGQIRQCIAECCPSCCK